MAIGSEDPEFAFVEEVRYPAVESAGTSHHPDNVRVCTSTPEQGFEDIPNRDREMETLHTLHFASESDDLAVEEKEFLPGPAPAPRSRRQNKVGVEVPVPPPCRSRRETEGKRKNSFHLPKSSCNAVTLDPKVSFQTLVGMIRHSEDRGQMMGEE